MNNRKSCSLPVAWSRFKKNLHALRSSFVNIIFILDKQGARWRLSVLLLSIFFLWLNTFLENAETINLKMHLGQTFSLLLSSNVQAQSDAFTVLISTFLPAKFFYHLALFAIPFSLALLAATGYLSDIYELEDTRVAVEFIWKATFGGKYGELKIENGKLSEESKTSPIYLIGGPGKIKIDLYSAALFEKANGRPHVISATTPKKKKEIEGFERFRFAHDLREQVIAPINVAARTQEGIKVRAEDVRMVYSILRDKKKKDLKKYPFKKEALPSYFYQTSGHVSKVGKKGFNLSPINPMPGIVKGELSNFITNHSLSDFLTSVGLPEKKN